MSVSWKVRGLRDLNRKLKRLGDELREEAMESAVETGAEVIQEEASRLAPVETGELSENIIIVTESDRRSATAKIGPSEHVWYGIFPELGGRGANKSNAYLRPAIDTQKTLAVNALAERLRNFFLFKLPSL